MVATSFLLDVITNPAQGGDSPLTAHDRVRIANEMVASLLDEHAHIEEIDTFGTTKKSRRCLTRPDHLAFRRLHEDWLSRADAWRPHLAQMQAAGQAITRFEELKDAMLSTRGLLKLTVEDLERGMEEIRQGKGHSYNSVEDLRRDIRAESERRRTDIVGRPAI